jgi:hypothetical protein
LQQRREAADVVGMRVGQEDRAQCVGLYVQGGELVGDASACIKEAQVFAPPEPDGRRVRALLGRIPSGRAEDGKPVGHACVLR